MSAPFWTDARIASLTALVADGVTYSEIGRQLGCSKHAAVGKAYRLDLSRTSPNWGLRNGTVPKQRSTLLSRLNALDVFPKSGGCAFPIGEPGRDGFRFCCDPAAGDGAPYCPHHTTVTSISAGAKLRIAEWAEAGPERHLRAAAHVRNLGGTKAQRAAR